MLISMDHDCTPDCPICIPEEDLLKFVKEKKIVPQSSRINFAMWFLYMPCAILAIAAVGDRARAIFGRDHQFHVAASGGQSSIGLAERLENIEHLLKDVRLLLGESADVMTAEEAGTSVIDDPNLGPSSHNLESPRTASSSEEKPDDTASSSEKKPDALAGWHPIGNVSVIQLITASLVITWLGVRGYIFGTNPDNSGRESGSELGPRTDSVDSSSELVCATPETNPSGNNSGCDTDADYSSRYSGWETDADCSGGDSSCWTDSDYSGGDSGWCTDADNSGSDFSWGAESDWENDFDYSGQVSATGQLGSLTSEQVNKALTEGIRNVGCEEATSNFDEDTVTGIQEPVTSELNIVLPNNESSSSQKRMTSSSIERAGFPHKVEVNFIISAQRFESSTLGDLSKSKASLFVLKDGTKSLHSEDDESSVQSEEVDHASWRDKESRAAIIIQARYRGHLVRMSRPLVQLREIAGIEEKLRKLNELAKNGTFIDFLRGKGAIAKSAAGEETMKLLLRLDNIQGSHPLVGQIGKSVAGEIVFLQEIFDALLS